MKSSSHNRATVNAVALSKLGTEVWKQIPGWEGLYEVSNLGRVKSCRPSAAQPTSKLKRKDKIINGIGGRWLRVVLCKNGYRKAYAIHYLVLLAFVGSRPFPKAEGRHLNDDKRNNRLYNLAYGTRLENRADRTKNGLDNYAVGERAGSAKLTEEKIRWIRTSNLSRPELAKKFNIASSTLRAILLRRTWKHIE